MTLAHPIIVLLISIYLVYTPNLARAEETGTETRIYSTFVTRGVNSATIEWKTEPETKGKIEYADESGIWQETPWQDEYTKDHRMAIFGLKPNTSYLYRVSAETIPGDIKTYRANFNTLDAKILGTQDNTLNPSTSFQSVLTPAPSLSQSQLYQNSNPYYAPNVLGQQTYGSAPYIQNIYPQIQTTPDPTPIPPTNTPTPKTTVAGFFQTNSTNLLLGIMIGAVVTVLFHQLTQRNTIPNKDEPLATSQTTREKTNQTTRQLRFTVGTDI